MTNRTYYICGKWYLNIVYTLAGFTAHVFTRQYDFHGILFGTLIVFNFQVSFSCVCILFLLLQVDAGGGLKLDGKAVAWILIVT